jgi:signal transduction histidine kinase
LSQLRLALDLWLDKRVYNGKERRIANQKNENFITIIKGNIKRLNKTIESVLTLADLEAGTVKHDREPFNMGDLLLKVTAGLRLIAEKKGLSLKLNLPVHVPDVLGDKVELARVISNLIDNAIKYTKTGTITVSAKILEHEIEVSVKDTGVGISLSKNLQSRIFDRFFQEKSSNEGVGLGLPICNKIIAAHGGGIWVEKSSKTGSTFKFTLPKPNIEDYCGCTPD